MAHLQDDNQYIGRCGINGDASFARYAQIRRHAIRPFMNSEIIIGISKLHPQHRTPIVVNTDPSTRWK